MTRAKKAKQAKPTNGATHDALGPDARAAYDRWLPVAARLETSALVAFGGADTQLALHNAQAAAASLAKERARIAEELPRVDVGALSKVPEVALAVRFAALEAQRPVDSGADVAAQLKTAHALRATLLAIAEGLAATGHLPAEQVKAIKKGRGPVDSAADCVALAELFAKHERKLAGKHAATAQMLSGAREVGTWLLANLRPSRAKRAGKPRNEAALEARDRLWSLLVKRHDEQRRVGYWLWGDAFGEHVPALQAQRRAAKKAKAAPAPALAPV